VKSLQTQHNFSQKPAKWPTQKAHATETLHHGVAPVVPAAIWWNERTSMRA